MKKVFFILALAFALPAQAQMMQAITNDVHHSAAGGTWSVVSSTNKGFGMTGGTTTAINTTGAKLITVVVEYFSGSGGGPATLTDSQSNTWTCLPVQALTQAGEELCYVISPSTSASHTFTNSGANNYSAMEVAAWTEAGTPTFDKSSGATSTVTTVQPGSVTPANANSLLVTSFATGYVGGAQSVNSPFTTLTQQPNVFGNNLGGGQGWFQETPTTAQNPTWTTTGTTSPNGIAENCSTIAVFKP